MALVTQKVVIVAAVRASGAIAIQKHAPRIESNSHSGNWQVTGTTQTGFAGDHSSHVRIHLSGSSETWIAVAPSLPLAQWQSANPLVVSISAGGVAQGTLEIHLRSIRVDFLLERNAIGAPLGLSLPAEWPAASLSHASSTPNFAFSSDGRIQFSSAVAGDWATNHSFTLSLTCASSDSDLYPDFEAVFDGSSPVIHGNTAFPLNLNSNIGTLSTTSTGVASAHQPSLQARQLANNPAGYTWLGSGTTSAGQVNVSFPTGTAGSFASGKVTFDEDLAIVGGTGPTVDNENAPVVISNPSFIGCQTQNITVATRLLVQETVLFDAGGSVDIQFQTVAGSAANLLLQSLVSANLTNVNPAIGSTASDFTLTYSSATDPHGLTLTGRAGGSTHPISTSPGLALDVDPAPVTDLEIRSQLRANPANAQRLTGGVLGARYSTGVVAYSTSTGLPWIGASGHTLEWTIINAGGSGLTVSTTTPSEARALLESSAGGLTGAAGDINVQVRVRALDGPLILDEVTTTLTLKAKNPSGDTRVGIVVDKSGSMWGTRWSFALEGADLFLQAMIADMGAAAEEAIMVWFNQADGILQKAGPVNLAPPQTVTQISAALSAAPPDVVQTPGGTTSVAAGIVRALAELNPGANPNKDMAILVLSDGMENTGTMLAQVFGEAPTVNWTSEAVPLFGVAVQTGAALLTKLQNSAIQSSGEAVAKASASDLLPWFGNRFADFFGWSPIVSTDPPLGAGQTDTTNSVTLTANDGSIMLLLYVDQNSNAANWDLSVQAPGTTVWLGAGDSAHITERSGKHFRILKVALPLDDTVYGAHWPGTWKVAVANNGPSGSYGLEILTKPLSQNGLLVLPFLFEQELREGIPIPLRTKVLNAGAPEKRARVKAIVQPPADWFGSAWVKEIQATGDQPRLALEQATVTALFELWDKNIVAKPAALAARLFPLDADARQKSALALQRLIERGVLTPPKPIEVELTHVGDGVYEGTYTATTPGGHQVAFEAELRKVVIPPLTDKLKLEVKKTEDLIAASPSAAHARQVSGYLDQFVRTQTIARSVNRTQFTVAFEADPERTIKSAQVIKGKLRLSVIPRDRKGRHLGPGGVDQVTFGLLGGRRTRFVTTDGDDGSYSTVVDLRPQGKVLKTPLRDLLHAKRWTLEQGGTRSEVHSGVLDLEKVFVSVGSVRMPLKVDGHPVDVIIAPFKTTSLLAKARVPEAIELDAKDTKAFETLQRHVKRLLPQISGATAKDIGQSRYRLGLVASAVENALDQINDKEARTFLGYFARGLGQSLASFPDDTTAESLELAIERADDMIAAARRIVKVDVRDCGDRPPKKD